MTHESRNKGEYPSGATVDDVIRLKVRTRIGHKPILPLIMKRMVDSITTEFHVAPADSFWDDLPRSTRMEIHNGIRGMVRYIEVVREELGLKDLI